jgi:hypothetical protein
MKLRITCKDGRVFTSDRDFQIHLKTVHARDPLMFAKFEVEGERAVVAVPWNSPLTAGNDVSHSDGACEDCMANGSASRIPIHPGCSCAPAGGWDDYIDGLEQPTETSAELWQGFLDYLNQVKRGRV